MARVNFDLQELQAFLAVAEKLSFRAAAEELCLSPPALSRRIDKLETTLGVRLLERSTRSVELTQVGRIFLARAKAGLEELEQAALGVADLSEYRVGAITVACVPSVAYYFMPAVIARFTQMYPQIRVRILDESANTVLNDVINRRADFGVNFIGTQEVELDFEPVFSEPFVLAVHPSHRFAKRKKVAWDEVYGERFIAVAKSSGNRVLIDSALAQAEKRPVSYYEVLHVSSLLGMVEMKLGVAAVPQLALPRSAHSTLKGVPLVSPIITRTLGLIKRKNTSLSPAAQRLYDMLRQEAEHH